MKYSLLILVTAAAALATRVADAMATAANRIASRAEAAITRLAKHALSQGTVVKC